MKGLRVCILLVLIYLHQSGARVLEGKVHQRITSVPSRGGSAPKTTENGSVSPIHRPIKTLHRLRRVASDGNYGKIRGTRYTTNYPKHHNLQAIPTPNTEFHRKSELFSTTAPYTENHHSWKKTRSLWLN